MRSVLAYLFLVWTVVLGATVPSVPFKRQVMRTSCGSASLQMLLGHVGYSLDQMAIIDVLRTSSDVGTTTWDLARGGCFSVLSSAVGTLYPDHLPEHGWPDYPLGSASFLHRVDLGSTAASDCWLDQLTATLDQGFPVAALMGGESPTDGGHFRVIVGYEGDTWYLHDPWTRGGIPHIMEYSSEQLCWLWNYTEHIGSIASYGPYPGIVVSPWGVDIEFFEHDNYTTFRASIEYISPPDGGISGFWQSLAASKSNAAIQLPPTGMTLVAGQDASISIPISYPGDKAVVEWNVIVDQLDRRNPGDEPASVIITASGVVSGTVPASVEYPSYSYTDLIGGTGVLVYH
ncbi:C39 family peptidase [Pelomyxa schiedti]|nr:C39 family peptidase [Pelomyxa schiedti]